MLRGGIGWRDDVLGSVKDEGEEEFWVKGEDGK